MTGYVLSADAERDLDHIWDFIAEDSIDMADRWIGKLFDAPGCANAVRAEKTNNESLARNPGLGRRCFRYLCASRNQARGSHRASCPVLACWFIPHHLPRPGLTVRRPIEIVAVAQGSRDIPAFLRWRVP
jgi:plasmid stabilization system protein ParE